MRVKDIIRHTTDNYRIYEIGENSDILIATAEDNLTKKLYNAKVMYFNAVNSDIEIYLKGAYK